MLALQFQGDQGLLARFANEEDALRWARAVRGLQHDWILDVVQAYTTVAVYVDCRRIALTRARQEVQHLDLAHLPAAGPGPLHRIPCCYEYQLDLQRVAEATGLTPEQVIELHTGTEYTVYAIGFCPGFPYLGYLPPPLQGVPRLASPRLRVEAGSVGLTGRQTGIYTEPRPGGWNLIGRTPLQLVDVADAFFPLRTGDRVRFERIDEAEFERRRGERLRGREDTGPGGSGGITIARDPGA
jgi:inhibitor of KinA